MSRRLGLIQSSASSKQSIPIPWWKMNGMPNTTCSFNMFSSMRMGLGWLPNIHLYESWESIDFTTIYIVERNWHLVFVLEIKPHANLIDISRCIGTEVRSANISTSSDVILSFLNCTWFRPWGWHLTHTNLTSLVSAWPQPKWLSTDKEMIQDLVPQSWWKHEILEPTGEAIFLKIVKDVKSKCISNISVSSPGVTSECTALLAGDRILVGIGQWLQLMRCANLTSCGSEYFYNQRPRVPNLIGSWA